MKKRYVVRSVFDQSLFLDNSGFFIHGKVNPTLVRLFNTEQDAKNAMKEIDCLVLWEVIPVYHATFDFNN